MTRKHIGERNGWFKLPPLEEWQGTCTTLHMWTQVVGKIRLTLSPDINHSWGSTLYVTTRGLTTSPVSYGTFTFAIDFDFIAHALRITTSKGTDRSFALEPMSVAVFYRKTMHALGELGIEVKIFACPVEVEMAIPFGQDEQHASYNADAAFVSGMRSYVPIASLRTSARASSERQARYTFFGEHSTWL